MNDRKPLPSPWDVQQKQMAESRERDRQVKDEMRQRAQATADRVGAQEAQAAREQEVAAEANFKATEKQKYLAAGGTQMQFDADWPRLRQQIVERAYLEGRTNTPMSETAAAAKRRLDLLYGRGKGE